jgi:hypothetical protein
MTVMFADIHERSNRFLFGLKTGILDGLSFSEILYADDTLLALKDTKTTNKLVAEID